MSIDIENIATACEALSSSERDSLEQLLRAHGIAAGYIGYSGDSIHTPLHDRVRILQLKGEDIFTSLQIDAAKIADALTSLQASEWVSPLPPVTVLSAGGSDAIRLSIPSNQLNKRWHWQIEIEQQGTSLKRFSGEFEPEKLLEIGCNKIGGNAYSARSLSTRMLIEGELPAGYHLLAVKCLDPGENAAPVTFTMTLIKAPSRCYEPAWAVEGKRLWGLSVQLYSLRSSRNWGAGDFTDLQQLIRYSASHGVNFLALNPLHALDTENPLNCSPYSPIDRRRLNIIYIDPEIEPEFAPREALQQKIKSLQSAGSTSNNYADAIPQCELIDYPAVMQLKLEVLAAMYQDFVKQVREQTPRGLAFEQFVTQEGKALLEFAEFEANRADARVNTCASEPRFYLYTQWLAEQQLAMCHRLAQQQGMKIGLIRDLAVGSIGEGAEVVLSKGLFSDLTSIGAPPDPLAPQGQNWGLPPLDPSRLRVHACQHFIELLRANMAYCGALRIDHVMALMRLWWCPRGSHGGDGAYVHYPVDDLFALLRLESQRSGCVVIGEDLGIVPPEVRTHLHSSAIFSNVLFYFEKYDGFQFKRPQHYAQKALAMVANHDVPTLAAWWNISDLDLRYHLKLISGETALKELRDLRIAEKDQVLRLLEEQWLLPVSWRGDTMDKAFDLSLCLALLKCCARSASQLLTVQLEDLILLDTPVNIPGTSTQYPNWQRKLPVDLNELLSSESVARIMTEIAAIRTD